MQFGLRSRRAAACASALLLLGCETRAQARSDGRDAPFALVELFTSEGCSSCPPADEALAAITEKAELRGERVYTLELHVDYWDDLGWKDPFSLPAVSERQERYQKRLGLAQLYTPQMIVNGREQFVGSRRDEAVRAIDHALAKPSTLHWETSAHPSGSRGEFAVDYSIGECAKACEITLALVQDRAETRVLRGENARRTLAHRHVVRALVTRPVSPSGRGGLAAKWLDTKTHPSAVVVFVSEAGSGAVLGARSIPLDPY